jgi:hypothetical protein
LLHSVAELARIELLVADFEGIRAAQHFRYRQAVGWGAGRILGGNGYGPFMDVVMGIGGSIENGGLSNCRQTDAPRGRYPIHWLQPIRRNLTEF